MSHIIAHDLNNTKCVHAVIRSYPQHAEQIGEQCFDIPHFCIKTASSLQWFSHWEPIVFFPMMRQRKKMSIKSFGPLAVKRREKLYAVRLVVGCCVVKRSGLKAINISQRILLPIIINTDWYHRQLLCLLTRCFNRYLVYRKAS